MPSNNLFNSSNTSIYLQFMSGQWLSLTMTTKYGERSLLPLLLSLLSLPLIMLQSKEKVEGLGISSD